MTATPAKPLTPRQVEVLNFIRNWISGDCILPPTMQQIANALHVSKVTIWEAVGELERKGWITRDKHRARSIRIIEVCPRCGCSCGGGK